MNKQTIRTTNIKKKISKQTKSEQGTHYQFVSQVLLVLIESSDL